MNLFKEVMRRTINGMNFGIVSLFMIKLNSEFFVKSSNSSFVLISWIIKSKKAFNLFKTIKENSNKISLSKVIVVYNLVVCVINPGIELSDDLVLQTSSNALYDSETTILDNIYRTLIIKKDPNYFYYKNEDETYSLMKNETNFIYELIFDNKKFHFASYNNAFNYLTEMLKTKVTKVIIEGDK